MTPASDSMPSGATATEASNVVELELPASPWQQQQQQQPRSSYKRRRQKPPARPSPVIYIELDRPSTSSADNELLCSSSCHAQQKERPTKSLDSSDWSFTEEEKKTSDEPLQEKRHANDRRRHGHNNNTCVDDWLGPRDEDDDNDHVDRLASLSLLLAGNSPRNNMQHKHDSGDDSDSDSVSPYFAPSDFQNSHWTRTLQRHMTAPNVSVAVIAIATALTHPLLFIVGALTALGTAHAAGYQYCDTVKANDDEKGENKDEQLQPKESANATSSQWFCWYNTRSALTIWRNPDITAGARCSVPECRPEQAPPLAPHDKDIFDEEWLQEHYPNLATDLVGSSGERFIGLNAIEFFHVFYADEAPYNFIECQKKRGDVDIVYGAWKDADLADAILSFHPNNSRQRSTLSQRLTECRILGESMQERVITFKAKTNSFLGPPYASTTKIQRYLVLSKRLAVLESKTTFADIPFHDRFCVMERWIVRAEKEIAGVMDCSDNEHQAQQRYTCSVTASCEVVFSQSCPFEYQIKKQASSTLVEISQAWCTMAQEALKLAEQAKCDRLLRDEGHVPPQHGSDLNTVTSSAASVECGVEVDYVPQAPVVDDGIIPQARLWRWPLSSTHCIHEPHADPG